LGRVDFKNLTWVLKAADPRAATMPAGTAPPEMAEVAIRYGMFLNNIIDFLIVAFCIFLVVKMMNRMIRKREDQAATKPV